MTPGRARATAVAHRILTSIHNLFLRLGRIERPAPAGTAAAAGTSIIRLQQPLFLICTGILLAWYLARPSAYSALALAALAGSLAASYAWVHRLATGLSGRRRLSYAALQVGDEIEELVELANQSGIPVLWAEFNDHSSIPGYTLTSVRAVDAHSSYAWRAHAVCTRRGLYAFGPWELLTGDPFGLFRLTISYDQKEQILVYPPLADLPARFIPQGRVQGDDTRLHLPLQAQSSSALTVRAYLPGDPLHHVHWPTTARREAPFVINFDPEGSSILWLIPDLDTRVHSGQGPDSTLETAITLAASLAEYLIQERMAVGLIAFSDEPCVVLPGRGRPHLWSILQALAGLEATGCTFDAALHQARAIISRRQRVLVITPSLDPAWAEELRFLGGVPGQAAAEAVLLTMADKGAGAGSLPVQDGQGDETRPDGRFSALGQTIERLAGLGISARELPSGMLKPRPGSYGDISRWDFKVLGTGRIFVRHSPHRIAGQAAADSQPRPGAS